MARMKSLEERFYTTTAQYMEVQDHEEGAERLGLEEKETEIGQTHTPARNQVLPCFVCREGIADAEEVTRCGCWFANSEFSKERCGCFSARLSKRGCTGLFASVVVSIALIIVLITDIYLPMYTKYSLNNPTGDDHGITICGQTIWKDAHSSSINLVTSATMNPNHLLDVKIKAFDATITLIVLNGDQEAELLLGTTWLSSLFIDNQVQVQISWLFTITGTNSSVSQYEQYFADIESGSDITFKLKIKGEPEVYLENTFLDNLLHSKEGPYKTKFSKLFKVSYDLSWAS